MTEEFLSRHFDFGPPMNFGATMLQMICEESTVSICNQSLISVLLVVTISSRLKKVKIDKHELLEIAAQRNVKGRL